MNKNINITALILAAGQGSRIGMPKWQLKFNGKSFLEIIKTKLTASGVDNTFCVYRENSKPTTSSLNYIINKTPELGMFSSIYYGTEKIKEADGILIWPVDHPFVELETLSKLIDAFKLNSNSIVKPIYNNRGGHPIILPEKIFKKIKTTDYDGGLRQFLNGIKPEYFNVNTNDPNILRNVNTPKDL
jgi:molybdenum cofactor cytidylyltransferase